MKTMTRHAGGLLGLLLAVAFMLGGCATGPDWNQRVGNYTYDQAIIDLGPPDKAAKLTDGTSVAEWLMHRGQSGGRLYFGGGYGGFHGHHHYYGPTLLMDDSPSYESFLRLVFAPDGTLRSWKKHIR